VDDDSDDNKRNDDNNDNNKLDNTMAELGHNYNIQCMKLLHELKARFPAVPDEVVRQCMKKHHNDREQCSSELAEESRNLSLGRVQAARSRNQALLSHQMEQLLKLESTLRHDRECLQELRQDVCGLESLYSMKKRGHIASFTMVDLQELQQDINHLRSECDCMSEKVTELTSGKVLLGDVSINEKIIIKKSPSTAVPDHSTCDTPSVTPPPHHHHQPSSLPVTTSSTPSSSSSELEGGKWSCDTCTFHNHPALDCCEVCLMPRIQMDFTSNSVA